MATKNRTIGRDDRTGGNGRVSSYHQRPPQIKPVTTATQTNLVLRNLQKAKASNSEEKQLRRMRSFFANHHASTLDQACQNELARWIATKNRKKLHSIGELFKKAVPDKVHRAILYSTIAHTDIQQPGRREALAAVDQLRALDKEL